MDLQHEDSEIAHEEDDLEGEGEHGDGLVPISIVDEQEEADEPEAAGHFGQEDVVQQDVEVEDLPFVLAKLVGGKQGDTDGAEGQCDGHVPLVEFAGGEDEDDVLEGDAEGDQKDQEVDDDRLLLSAIRGIILAFGGEALDGMYAVLLIGV